MTNNSINIAIAEIIGADLHWKAAKDYCSDLNAMHEAEKVLTKEHCDSYEHRLGMTVNRPWHATARQRAEAFLRTLGKWENQTE